VWAPLEGGADLVDDKRHFGQRHGATLHALAQGLAHQELHHRAGLAGRQHVEVDDRDDVRMSDARSGLMSGAGQQRLVSTARP
jgi:hypothetical protein